jgi:nicotinamidase-related amidase
MDELRGLTIARTLDEACDPARLALLVYDMQVGILRQIGDGDRVVARVKRVLEACRAVGIRTVFTRHVTLPTALMGASQLRMWMSWQRAKDPADVVSPFPADAPQTQLTPELVPSADEAVIDKLTMSAFEGTPLDTVFRDCSISAFAIVGVALEVGIEPTVRHAADLGYLPIVVTDACGSGNGEAGERTLASLRFAGDAILTDTEGFVRTIAG